MTATWKQQGPRPILTNTIKEQAGAIRSVVAHPTNPDIIWVGAVNGGVWKTINATTESTWTTATDTLPFLSVTALDLDLADTQYNTLVAGIGRFSSFAGVGGKLIGLAKTTDGGTTWTAIGAQTLSNTNIASVAVRGSTIMAASVGGDGANNIPGLFRSTDGGKTFTNIAGTA